MKKNAIKFLFFSISFIFFGPSARAGKSEEQVMQDLHPYAFPAVGLMSSFLGKCLADLPGTGEQNFTSEIPTGEALIGACKWSPERMYFLDQLQEGANLFKFERSIGKISDREEEKKKSLQFFTWLRGAYEGSKKQKNYKSPFFTGLSTESQKQGNFEMRSRSIVLFLTPFAETFLENFVDTHLGNEQGRGTQTKLRRGLGLLADPNRGNVQLISKLVRDPSSIKEFILELIGEVNQHREKIPVFTAFLKEVILDIVDGERFKTVLSERERDVHSQRSQLEVKRFKEWVENSLSNIIALAPDLCLNTLREALVNPSNNGWLTKLIDIVDVIALIQKKEGLASCMNVIKTFLDVSGINDGFSFNINCFKSQAADFMADMMDDTEKAKKKVREFCELLNMVDRVANFAPQILGERWNQGLNEKVAPGGGAKNTAQEKKGNKQNQKDEERPGINLEEAPEAAARVKAGGGQFRAVPPEEGQRLMASILNMIDTSRTIVSAMVSPQEELQNGQREPRDDNSDESHRTLAELRKRASYREPANKIKNKTLFLNQMNTRQNEENMAYAFVNKLTSCFYDYPLNSDALNIKRDCEIVKTTLTHELINRRRQDPGDGGPLYAQRRAYDTAHDLHEGFKRFVDIYTGEDLSCMSESGRKLCERDVRFLYNVEKKLEEVRDAPDPSSYLIRAVKSMNDLFNPDSFLVKKEEELEGSPGAQSLLASCLFGSGKGAGVWPVFQNIAALRNGKPAGVKEKKETDLQERIWSRSAQIERDYKHLRGR